ncbi:carbon-nitrogen hydrolase family protein [Maritimibacter sp. DP1N21-5]|uniref:carbon-nitrogen hydrolase family protein n=1 Tax=Maritimibacter sp. DP1N21-5 TaxID=2836867 RepID=UPI001C479BE6|nr:carbon-nitrogen hydrolase family protein [Maritimibacter sp. DP1N21-5]MBV7410746.1 carbon-nitrogen hydrolase family protein [Maritimibacter sp. DP1N21-5]
MKIAAACYPLSRLADWDAYETKITRWIEEAAGRSADLLVFPEYGAMELASLSGATTLADQMQAVSAALPRAWDIQSRLAMRHGLHILAASGPVFAGARALNRAMFLGPEGGRAPVDKRVMTPWERMPMDMEPGRAPTLFDTALGRVGVQICYDCEFPLPTRAMVEAGMDVLLVPSATETLAGYHRVRIGAQARALEGQVVTVQSPTQGIADWCEVVDVNRGAAGVFCPPDLGLPDDGVLALGQEGVPGWTYAEVDLAALAHVRASGNVRTRRDWEEQAFRQEGTSAKGSASPISITRLR